MVDHALSVCFNEQVVLTDRTPLEEDVAFTDDLAKQADLGRAMTALKAEPARKLSEIRAILGDVKKRRSQRIRSFALSKVREERASLPAWDLLSVRDKWRAGEIVNR
ncbi:unnamed protein product [Hapterophycus canaliculatus]